MTTLGVVLVGLSIALPVYAYLAYPALLWLAGLARRRSPRTSPPGEWPEVSVSLPAYNEESSIRDTLDAWLSVDYPRDKLQILVISDGSTDATDEIVAGFAAQGVELLRLETRSGKTGAENQAAAHLRGEIIINTDASVRVRPDAVKPLVLAMLDPEVGVASGRDVSVGPKSTIDNVGEAGYVGYEMWVRALETRAGGIIGASGCYYAIRPELHRRAIPDHLSRDFAAALTAREHGYRAVSVDDAVCLVPRTASLRAELRRKIRTMARGLKTVWHKRGLLNPLRHGLFAWKLASHKLCRWLVPLAAPLGLVGLVILATRSRVALGLLAVALLGLLLGAVGLGWPERRRRPRVTVLPAYVLAANLAAVLGWSRALRREARDAVWEPTRRPARGGGG